MLKTWLDYEMGGDMTHQIEYGDVEPRRMTMLPAVVPENGPHDPLPKDKPEPKEEPVNATCSEKTEE